MFNAAEKVTTPKKITKRELISIVNSKSNTIPIWLNWWIIRNSPDARGKCCSCQHQFQTWTKHSVINVCILFYSVGSFKLVFLGNESKLLKDLCQPLLKLLLNLFYKGYLVQSLVDIGLFNPTRGPQALTVTWVSETLHWILVRRVHICISTAPLL